MILPGPSRDIFTILWPKLKEYWAKSVYEDLYKKGAPFDNFQLELSEVNISQMAKNISHRTYCYFRDKNQFEEILAIDSVHEISEYNKVKTIVENCKFNENCRYFGGRRFDLSSHPSAEWEEFNDCFYFLPLAQWSRKNKKYTLTINFPSEIIYDKLMQDTFLKRLENTFNIKNNIHVENESENFQNDLRNYGDHNTWVDMIDKCVQDIKSTQLEKVVLARKVIFHTSQNLKGNHLLSQVLEDPQECYIFFLQKDEHHSFLSISPEKLFELNGQTIVVDSIAGTRNRGVTAKEDEELAQQLQGSIKDLHEHHIVAKEIQEKLQALCSDTINPKKENILKLKYVQHLYTSFNGLVREGIDVFDIIDKIHPTPAVGGRPWVIAKEFIKDFENMDRGLYAAPVGYISKNTTIMVVGIRSCLIENNNIHIYGGAGIVNDSIGEDEWIETHNKMKNFLQMF